MSFLEGFNSSYTGMGPYAHFMPGESGGVPTQWGQNGGYWDMLGGASSGLLNDFLAWNQNRKDTNALKDAQNSANAANEARYGQQMDLHARQQALANSQMNETGRFLMSNFGQGMNSMARGNDYLQQARQLASSQFDAAGQEWIRHYDRTMGDYDNAKRELSGQGDFERRRINEQATAGRANAAQALQSRGLGNSTVVNAAQRGVQREADRSHEQLTEGLGRLYSGVEERRAGARQSLNAGLQAHMANRTATETGLLNRQAGHQTETAQMRQSYGRDIANHMTNRTAFETGLLGDQISTIGAREDRFNDLLALQMQRGAQGGGGGGGGGMGGMMGGDGSMGSTIGGVAGMAIGGAVAGPFGAMIGGALGGAVGGLF